MKYKVGEDITTDDIELFGHNSIRVKAGKKNIYINPFEMKISPKDAFSLMQLNIFILRNMIHFI